jgi:hypothetical protein
VAACVNGLQIALATGMKETARANHKSLRCLCKNEFYCNKFYKIVEIKLRTLKLQRFAYFWHFPASPNFSALAYSGGRFSSMEDEGLKANVSCDVSNFFRVV